MLLCLQKSSPSRRRCARVGAPRRRNAARFGPPARSNRPAAIHLPNGGSRDRFVRLVQSIVLDELAVFSPKVYCFLRTIFPVKKEEVTW